MIWWTWIKNWDWLLRLPLFLFELQMYEFIVKCQLYIESYFTINTTTSNVHMLSTNSSSLAWRNCRTHGSKMPQDDYVCQLHKCHVGIIVHIIIYQCIDNYLLIWSFNKFQRKKSLRFMPWEITLTWGSMISTKLSSFHFIFLNRTLKWSQEHYNMYSQ